MRFKAIEKVAAAFALIPAKILGMAAVLLGMLAKVEGIMNLLQPMKKIWKVEANYLLARSQARKRVTAALNEIPTIAGWMTAVAVLAVVPTKVGDEIEEEAGRMWGQWAEEIESVEAGVQGEQEHNTTNRRQSAFLGQKQFLSIVQAEKIMER